MSALSVPCVAALAIVVAGATAAQAQVPLERAAALRKEAFKEMATAACEMPVSRVEEIVRGLNAQGLHESEYSWNWLRQGTCQALRGNGLPPFEQALMAMTDARQFDPCTYDPKRDYSEQLHADPFYQVFESRYFYDSEGTFTGFSRAVSKMAPARRECFFGLIRSVLTGTPWTPVAASPSTDTQSPMVSQRAPVAAAPGAGRRGRPTPIAPAGEPPQAIAPTESGAGQRPPAPPAVEAPAATLPPEPAPAVVLTSPTEGRLDSVDLAQRLLVIRLADGTPATFAFDDTTTVTALDGSARQVVRSEGRALQSVRGVRLQWAPDASDQSRRMVLRITVTAVE